MDFDYGDVGTAEFSGGWSFWQWKTQWSFLFIYLFSLSFFLLVADVVGMFLSMVARWWVGRIFVGFSSGGKKTTVIGISNGLVNSGFVTVVQQIFFFFWFWIDCSGPSNRLVFALIPKMMQ